MDNIDTPTRKVLFFIERIKQIIWATTVKTSISAKMRQAKRIIKLCQYLYSRYLKLKIRNFNSARLKFAVHDQINRIVYERKATGKNPQILLFKTTGKTIAYNRMSNDSVKK